MIRFHTASLFDTEPPDHLCHFGISAGIAAFVLPAITATIGEGALAGGIASGIGGLATGAAGGAALSGITGGNPLTGALTGGLSGGLAGGLGPVIGEATGLGASAGGALAGAAGGGLGSLLTGQSPLTGALAGGVGGLLTGAGTPSGGGTGATSITPAASTGGAVGAGSTAPLSIAAPSGGPSSDLASAAGAASGAAASGAGSSLAAAGGSNVNSIFGGSDFTNSLLASPDVSPAGYGATQTTTQIPASAVGDAVTGGASSAGGIGSFLAKNPSTLLGAGALGLNMLRGSKPSQAETQLRTQAGEAGTHAAVLAAYQETGTLPPGLQSAVDRYRDNAVAQIKGQYASLGLAGSTMEAQAIANAHQAAAVSTAEIASNLAKQGIAWEQLSAQDLDHLILAQQNRDQSFTSALTSFAAGLGGTALKAG